MDMVLEVRCCGIQQLDASACPMIFALSSQVHYSIVEELRQWDGDSKKTTRVLECSSV